MQIGAPQGQVVLYLHKQKTQTETGVNKCPRADRRSEVEHGNSYLPA